MSDFRTELDELEAAGRLRARPLIDSPNGRFIVLNRGGRQRVINWASNDYLGLLKHPLVRNGATRAVRNFGAGAGSARLLSGGLRIYRRLEERLRNWLGYEDALLTTTGFQLNLAVITSIASAKGDAIILDRLCHASMYDGARLAAAGLHRFAHNDLADLKAKLTASADARRRLVCVESVYSMDGDEAPLAEIAALCREHDALLLVDEAHAIGVFGPGGRGRCAELGVRPDFLVGTCSKSLAAQGGFVCAASDALEVIVNRGRSFIFSTAPVPAAIGAALGALDALKREPDRGVAVLAEAAQLREALAARGWQTVAGRSPIVPVVVKQEAKALALAERLLAGGHYAPAIRPPTVPADACRLRLTLTGAHKPVDVRRLLEVLGEA